VHVFPPSAYDFHSPPLLALLSAQHTSHPIEPRLLVGLVSLLAVNVIFWLFGACLAPRLPVEGSGSRLLTRLISELFSTHPLQNGQQLRKLKWESYFDDV
jgi:hypothetical protein